LLVGTTRSFRTSCLWLGVDARAGAVGLARILSGHAVEGVEVPPVGVVGFVQVSLGGLDVGLPEPVHYGGEVGAAREEPGVSRASSDVIFAWPL